MFRTVGGRTVLCTLAVFAGFFFALHNRSKKPPAKETAVTEGARLYKQNCAVCHGNDGTGGAPPPSSSRFTTPAPDLTTLSKRHGGKFPTEYVGEVLRSGVKMPAHHLAEMPVWGTIFKATTKADDAQVTERIADITAYLESIQAK